MNYLNNNVHDSALPKDWRENLDRVDRAYWLGTSEEIYYPPVFVIEPTSVCNYACIMCPNPKYGPDVLGHMDFALFQRIVDEISPYALAVMLYWVGEPLLHRELPRMIRYLKDWSRARVIISTNASRLRGRLAEEILDSGLDELIVGIDGDSDTSFEQIRIRGRFGEVVNNVEDFLRLKGNAPRPVVVVQFLEMESNSHEVRAFLERWQQYDCVPLVTWIDTWSGHMPELRQLAKQLSPYNSKDREACADLWFKMVVNWRGQVVLCCHDWAATQVLGDLNSQTVGSIWNSQALDERRQMHRGRQFRGLNLCDSCVEWSTVDDERAHWESPHIGYSFDPSLREGRL